MNNTGHISIHAFSCNGDSSAIASWFGLIWSPQWKLSAKLSFWSWTYTSKITFDHRCVRIIVTFHVVKKGLNKSWCEAPHCFQDGPCSSETAQSYAIYSFLPCSRGHRPWPPSSPTSRTCCPWYRKTSCSGHAPCPASWAGGSSFRTCPKSRCSSPCLCHGPGRRCTGRNSHPLVGHA